MNISVQHITKTYKSGKKALDGVSIEIESPALIGLVGPNGAGKSTLMKLLVSTLLPSSGSILLDNEPLQLKEKYLKNVLGYLPQSFGLYDELTVWQFLDYMAALKQGTGIGDRGSGIIDRRSLIREQIAKVLEQANLGEIKKQKIRTLSGGQRQRVGIAQALLGDPALLILDEPTVGLDPEERKKIRNLLSQCAQNKIVLLSTHIIEDVYHICGRIIVINLGKILFDGKPEELINEAQGYMGILEPSLEDAYLYIIEQGLGQ